MPVKLERGLPALISIVVAISSTTDFAVSLCSSAIATERLPAETLSESSFVETV